MKKFTITQRWAWLFLVLTFPLLAVAQTDPIVAPDHPVFEYNFAYVGYCEESKTMYFWGEIEAYGTDETIEHNGETLDEVYNIHLMAQGEDMGSIDEDVFYSWLSSEGFPFWVFRDYSHCSEARKVVFDESWTGLDVPLAGWFYGFENLEEIEGIEYLCTYGQTIMTDMSYMFAGCHRLQTLDLSHFYTGYIEDMSHMFEECYQLESLDLSSFDTSNVTNMEGMFADCTNLRRIYCSDTWTATTSNDMFDGCTKLVGELGTRYDATHEDVSYARVDAVGTPGYFSTTPRGPMTPYVIWCVGNKTLYFTYTDDAIAEGDTFNGQTVTAVWYGADVLNTGSVTPGWTNIAVDVKHVVIDATFAQFRPKSCYSWFASCMRLEDITGLENLNTSEVTNMSLMFLYCRTLTSLDLSSFDTSNVTDFSGMFLNCSALTSLDVSNFDTSNATSTNGIFGRCTSLTSLDVSSFDTSNWTSTYGLFTGCRSLTSLDLSNFDVSNVEEMNNMFKDCSALTTIYCNDTWTPATSPDMFTGCTNLVGEYGTSYTSSATDASKANPGEEGYFTLSEEVLTARDGGDGWYYTTYYNGEHSRFVDNNTEVYVAQADWDNNSIILELNDDSVDKRLLKGNAFILRSTQPTITLSLCSNEGRPIGGGALSSNELEGSAKTEDVWGGHAVIYTLGKVNGVLGFYEYTGDKFNARKAFLYTTRYGGSNAPLRFSFGGEDTATGIEASTMDKVQSTGIYDLQGRRVAQPTKGLYVVNGKKVFMK